MGLHNRHAEAVSDQHYQSCTFRMLPARERGHVVAVHQGCDVTTHAIVPGSAARVEFAQHRPATLLHGDYRRGTSAALRDRVSSVVAK
ncbi:hypothetical protein D9M69_466830 [compost metagenome]